MNPDEKPKSPEKSATSVKTKSPIDSKTAVVPKSPQKEDEVEKKAEAGDSEEETSSYEDSSGSSVNSEEITRAMVEMYGSSDSDEMEEEELEEEGEEEEDEEEYSDIDLEEYKQKLEKQYVKGMEIDEKYLYSMNRQIQEIDHQIFVIEIYINNVRTFDGYNNHWLRIKIFDSPCFEIHPCMKVASQASLYANRSNKDSKGSGPPLNFIENNREGDQDEVNFQKEDDPSQEKVGKKKHVVIDLSALDEDERKRKMEQIMKEEVSPVRTTLGTKASIKVASKLGEYEADIPKREVSEQSNEDIDEFPSVWMLKEPVENGKTIMFPMEPKQIIHQMLRMPMKIFVLSTSGKESWATFSMCQLVEAAVRASKGPPYPISSFQKFNIFADGAFGAKVTGTVRIMAMGPQHISDIKCDDNPNERCFVVRRREATAPAKKKTDIQKKPPILSGPQDFTLYDVVKSVNERRQAHKYQEPPPPAPKRYFVEDLVVNREANTVERAPKKDYYALRAEIDRYLVLNKSKARDKKSEAKLEEDEEDDSEIIEEGSDYSLEEEGLEEEENAEEEDGSDDPEDEDAEEQHVDKVFQSLIETYGWPRAEESIFSISPDRGSDSP